MIEKTAKQTCNFRRSCRLFVNARTAFKSLLAALNLRSEQSVLLPAYIGWSANEGSGVFDPIAELGLRFNFYRLDESLHIDLNHLESRLRAGSVKVLVLIHYFGYVDPQYRQAVELARRYGAMVVEDEAHALFSDWVGGVCGRLGDAAIFSLHKMLPIPGGMLTVAPCYEELFNGAASEPNNSPSPWNYDFHAIAQRRRENARHLTAALVPLVEHVTPLRPTPTDGEVPQTLPVIIHGYSRDALYFALNDAGFGAISLYHTMIPQITEEQFPDADRVSRRILNLPIHQDVKPAHLDALVAVLNDVFEGHRVCQPHIDAPCGASVRKITA